MKFPSPVSLDWIATLIGAKIEGDSQGQATGINEIHKVEKGDLVFVDHPKYYDTCIQSAASFIIINTMTAFPPGKALLIVEDPFEAYQKIVRHFRPFTRAVNMLSETAVIDPSAYIAPNVYIGEHVIIGRNCRIHPNVSILDYTQVGDDVIIQAGTVIGSDAFYYNTKKDRSIWYKKMESGGRVVIGDAAEIGAGCTVDRGVSHDTVIGAGTKIDNMVHIGHDTVIGKNCLIAAQVGIAGATTLGDGVILWGQVGVSKTLSIGDNTVILAQSGVGKTIPPNKVYLGTPADEAGIKKKELVWIKRVPELWKKVMDGK